MSVSFGIVVGFIAWFLVRYLVAGLYTVDQNERAVKTSFGRAERIGDATTLDDPISESLSPRSASATAIRRCASSRRAGRTSSGRGRRSTRSPSPPRR